MFVILKLYQCYSLVGMPLLWLHIIGKQPAICIVLSEKLNKTMNKFKYYYIS